MLNRNSWLVLSGLCLINSFIYGGHRLDIPSILICMLWGTLALLVNSRSESKWALFFNLASSPVLFGLSFRYPLILSALPLVSSHFKDRRFYWTLLPFLFLPYLLALPYEHFLLLAFAVLLGYKLSALSRNYQTLAKKYYRDVDQITSDKRKLEENQKSLVVERELSLENGILNERNRIAQEIHDNVGHRLTSAILQVNSLCLVAPETLKDPLGQVLDNLNLAMDDIRSSVHQLHGESLDLKLSLEKIVRDFAFCPVFLSLDLSSNPPGPIHYAILAICNEALTNTAKHSNATRMDISLRQSIRGYQLLIVDNGSLPGQEDNPSPPDEGIGLYNMEDRIRQLGGQIHFSQERGFRIFATIPWETKGESQ